MHSGCRHPAIGHQVVQPMQQMNSSLSEHALWRDLEAHAIPCSPSNHHHLVDMVCS